MGSAHVSGDPMAPPTARPASKPRRARVALRRAVVFVTTHCNFRCGFCEFAAGTLPRERKRHFPLEMWGPFLTEFKTLGGRELYLTGGEPLMHPQFWEMLTIAGREGLSVHRITTNGSMAKRMGEHELQLIRETVRAVQVSVDSPRAGEHDQSRGFDGSFERLSAFIVQLQRAGIMVHVSNVLTRELFARSADLIAWAHSAGVKHVNFQPCNWSANYGDYEAVEDKVRYQVPSQELDALDAALAEAHRAARRLRVTTNLPLLRRWVRAFCECQGTEEFFFNRMFRRFRCYVPHTTVYVGSDGEIFPCTLIRRVGTLRESSLRDLWLGAMQPVRDRLEKGAFWRECNSCYCDFPANVRHNLVRHPAGNAGLALRTLAYYTGRLRTY